MNSSPIEQYLAANLRERSKLLAQPEVANELRRWLGDGAFTELSGLTPVASHLGPTTNRLLFVPGIMGSLLKSQLGGIWWIDVPRARTKLNELALATDGVSDADAAAGIEPCGIDLVYEPFSRKVVTEAKFGYEAFAYDWRRLVTTQTERLKLRILELYEQSRKPVHLVGHSLGGLMIRSTLMLHGRELWPKVGRIVFIGTPHYGSPSIAGYLKNHLWGWDAMAVLGVYLSRRTFRSMWGALSLLPAPVGVYPDTSVGDEHPCANFDMYDQAAWKLDLQPDEVANLQRVLDAVRHFHQSLHDWHATLSGEQRRRMLVIAGVGVETLFRLEFDVRFWGQWEKTRRLTERHENVPNYEGDGSVSVASAKLDQVNIRYVAGRHASLPNIPHVARDVFAWLREEPLQLSDSMKGALASHLAGPSESPFPHLEGRGDSPGRDTRHEDIGQDELATLVSRFEAGQLPSVQFARLL